MIGQGILQYCSSLGLDKDTAGSWCSLILVLLSVVLTGFNIYPKLATFGGAGALVPITGFANSVSAPCIEFKKEGQVFLYGIFSSWVLGLIYWGGKMLGIF